MCVNGLVHEHAYTEYDRGLGRRLNIARTSSEEYSDSVARTYRATSEPRAAALFLLSYISRIQVVEQVIALKISWSQ